MTAPTTATRGTDGLERDALAVLHPTFHGTDAPPAWLLRLLESGGMTGVGLFGRNVVSDGQVTDLTARLHEANPEVLVALDEEGGDVTRLEVRTGSSVPGSLALGAVDDPDLTRAVAAEIGRRLVARGITLNWAPSADVNSNPDNPVIGSRSFGADPELVARHTVAYVEGLQSAGVAACVKHFPGHGDTDVDSHLAMPRIGVDRDTLTARELLPFRAAIAAGTRSVMSAHILVPALDPELPGTLSPAVLNGLLRAPVAEGGLGFEGVIVTDGMEMDAVAARWGVERGNVLAIAAGADAICVGGTPSDEAEVLRMRDALVDAVRAGELPGERLHDAAERVRALGRWTAARRAEALGAGTPAGDTGAAGRDIGAEAARRAVRVSAPAGAPAFAPLTGPAHVLVLTPTANVAVGTETPWGLGPELTRLLPGTTTDRRDRTAATEVPALVDEVLRATGDRRLVVVVRDVHRHAWMAGVLDALVAARPDTAVVEMGVPQAPPSGALHIATHGAARVCAEAAAEVLTGRSPGAGGA
ncbi:glycoside hydrolase family 3 protein [Streptomyces sp. ST2-7A]|uniref:glycoside hydrolase family 3 protein n=1 Tax=Streptomyces sp. ST2-7A TaxID=2907214 RepID=UPI001F2802A5|nr:glycoside hydrolase family 3 N-terminal domain-containing protein [Streptomyces sp. ST2-7A]MCE7082793.1 glycoside hydrolase family 3 protein [Streptomyces sp. ST2-7A]